jgi:hypothetical protein
MLISSYCMKRQFGFFFSNIFISIRSLYRGFIVKFLYMLTMYLRFITSILLPHFSPPLVKTISTGVIVLFSDKYKKYIDHIHPPSPLHSPFLSHWYPPKTRPVSHSCPSFLNAYSLFKGLSLWHFTHEYIPL